MTAAIPRQSAQWDERRNSSRVFPVTPEDIERGQAAYAILKRLHPALCQWIEDGHPHLTEGEHLARFGEPYRATRSRSARVESTA